MAAIAGSGGSSHTRRPSGGSGGGSGAGIVGSIVGGVVHSPIGHVVGVVGNTVGSVVSGSAAASSPTVPTAQQNAAIRYQQQILRKYVFHQEKQQLVNAHIDFAHGLATGPKVQARQIGEDLHAAAGRIRNASPRAVLGPDVAHQVHHLNKRGYVVPGKVIHQTVTRQNVAKAATLAARPRFASPEERQGRKAVKFIEEHTDTGGGPFTSGFSNVLGKVLGARTAQMAPTFTGSGASTRQQLTDKPTLGSGLLTASLLIGPEGGIAAKAITAGAERLAAAKGTAEFFAHHPSMIPGAVGLSAKSKAASLVAQGTGIHVPVATALAVGAANEFQALRKHPAETLGTTGRTLESIPGAALAIPADLYLAAKEGDTKPLQGFINQQKEYLKMYSTLVGGDPYTTVDPATGKQVSMSGEEIAQKQLGLVPAITAGLSGLALAKGAARLHPTEATLKVDRRTRSLVEQINDPSKTPRERTIAKKKLAGLAKTREESPRAAQVGRKVESQRSQVLTQSIHMQAAREYAGAGERKPENLGLQRESVPEVMARLNAEPINEHISKGDVVRYLGSHGYREDTKNVLDLIAEDRKNLRKGKVSIEADAISTRPVMDAILANPEILRDSGIKAALDALGPIQHGRSVEAHSIRTDEAQTTPNPVYEVPTHVPQAQARNLRLPWERKPAELRDLSLKEKSGRDMDQAIRARAKDMQRKAKRLRETAKELRRQGRDARAATLEDRANRYEADAARSLSVVDRMKHAHALLRQAIRIEEDKPRKGDYRPDGSLPDPKQLRREADALMAEDARQEAKRTEVFMNEIRGAQKKHGLKPPTFHHSRDVTKLESLPGEEYPGSRGAPKHKHLEGRLEAEGRVNEAGWATMANMDLQRMNLELDRHSIGAIRDNSLRLGPRDSIFVSSAEYARLHEAGAIPKGYVKKVASRFAGPISRNEALSRELLEAKMRAETERSGERNIYMIWPRSRSNEFEAQLKPWAGWQRKVRKFGRIQTGLMLGTSPTWAAFQIPANPLVLMAQHWNPAAYARATHTAIQVWRKADPRDRAAVDAAQGATSGDFTRIGNHDPEMGLTPDAVEVFSRARHMVGRTAVGRIATAAWKNLIGGGPITGFVRRYETHTRRFGMYLEMDRLSGLDLRGNTRAGAHVRAFVDKTLGLQGTVYKHMDQLKGIPRSEWPSVYAHNHKMLQELQGRLFDAMGEWASLTTRERGAASVTAFYPFLRMSLRWMFYGFPKNHPIKAALLLNLAQSNVAAYEQAIGGKPSFLQDFGAIVTHPGGKPTGALQFARSAPGGNALIEAIGDGGLDLSTVFRPSLPLIGVTVGALQGKDVFGRTSDLSFGQLLEKGILNLSPLTRPFAANVGGGRSDLSKLYLAVAGKPTGLKGSLIPQVTTSPYVQSQLIELNRIVGAAFGAPTKDDARQAYAQVRLAGGNVAEARKAQAQAHRAYEEGQVAFDQLDAWYRRYGIQTTVDQKQLGNLYSKSYSRYYHQWPDVTAAPKKPSGPFAPLSFGGGDFKPESFGGSGKQKHRPATVARRSPTLKNVPAIGISRQVAPMVERLARQRGLPPAVMMAQLEQETNFNPGETSGAGAQGISQFIPATAQSYGVKPGTSQAAVQSQLVGQANYMADLVKSQGSIEGALNAYYGSATPYADASGTGSYAQKVMAKAEKYGGAGVTTGSKHYSPPFPHADMGRIDMGVDYTGSGPIKAIGKARVVNVGASGWPSGGAGPAGQGVLYQLLDGPRKGKHVYVYEGITPSVKPGQTLKKGQTIGTFYPGSSIEIGFADSAGSPLASSYYSEGDVTKPGQHAAAFLQRIGQPGTTPGGVAVGSTGTATYSTSSGTTGTASASYGVPAAQTGTQGQPQPQGKAPTPPLKLLSLIQGMSKPGGTLRLAGIPAALTKQFERDPMSLTQQELADIAAAYRKARAKLGQGSPLYTR